MSFSYRGKYNGNGFVIGSAIFEGSGSTPVVVRGLGTSLHDYTSESLYDDPQLFSTFTIQSANLVNDDWWDQNGDGIKDAAASLDAFREKVDKAGMVDFSSETSRDSALAFDITQGGHSFLLYGPAVSDAGEFLFELANCDTTTTLDVVNVSVRRKFINGGRDMMSFAVAQGGTRTFLITAHASSVDFGGLPALSDPVIALYSGATQIAYNDNWATPQNGGASQQQISAAIAATGQTTFASSSSKEAAILADLGPGYYSISLWGGLVGTQVDGEVALSVTLVP